MFSLDHDKQITSSSKMINCLKAVLSALQTWQAEYSAPL